MNVIKDPLDEMLKADAMMHRETYFDDAGFTLRVIDKLPHESPVSKKARVAILVGFTLFAAIFVAFFAGGGNFLIDAVMDLATSSMTSAAFAFVAFIGIMMVVSVGAANEN